MNYASIRTCDIANGEGVRVSLFVSGCTHKCKGCFNEEAQSFAYGKPFTQEVVDSLLEAIGKPYIAGLTLLGGEPMEPRNQEGLIEFLRAFRARWPREKGEKTLWIYTGCVLESDLLPSADAAGVEYMANKRWRTRYTDEILAMTDVLVDGPFIESLKDISLKFRGSSNQRIIELHPENPSKEKNS